MTWWNQSRLVNRYTTPFNRSTHRTHTLYTHREKSPTMRTGCMPTSQWKQFWIIAALKADRSAVWAAHLRELKRRAIATAVDYRERSAHPQNTHRHPPLVDRSAALQRRLTATKTHFWSATCKWVWDVCFCAAAELTTRLNVQQSNRAKPPIDPVWRWRAAAEKRDQCFIAKKRISRINNCAGSADSKTQNNKQ